MPTLASPEQLQQLIELVRESGIDIVLVWKIDRLSRNLVEREIVQRDFGHQVAL